MNKNQQEIFIKVLVNKARLEKAMAPLPEAVVLKRFLHLRPKYIVRFVSFSCSHCIDRIWPEVLLIMDFETAAMLREKLESLWQLCKGIDLYALEKGQPRPESAYRVDEYNDADFYEIVHRVPVSIENLKKLGSTIGDIAVEKIIEI